MSEIPVRRVTCQIRSIDPLPQHVFRVVLDLPEGGDHRFYPGQYLSLHIPDREQPAFYSIANAPGNKALELHIQAFPEWESAVEVIEFLRSQSEIELSLAMGYAKLNSVPEEAITLLASGTGFAQMKSIIEDLLPREDCPPIDLHWTARSKDDLYFEREVLAWDARHEQFRFFPIVSGDEDLSSTLHHDLLVQSVLNQSRQLNMVFVSGSSVLVQTIYSKLSPHGLQRDKYFSDALEWIDLKD